MWLVLALNPQIKMAISRRRRLFGAPIKFSDSINKEDEAYGSTIDIRTQPALENELHRRERHIGIQANPFYTESSAQTHWCTCISNTIAHMCRAQPVNAICQTVPRVLEQPLTKEEEVHVKDFLERVYEEYGCPP